jgi:hypothetical protein
MLWVCSQLVGIIAVLQRHVVEAQERNNVSVDRLLGKPLQRLNGLYQRQIVRSSAQRTVVSKLSECVAYVGRAVTSDRTDQVDYEEAERRRPFYSIFSRVSHLLCFWFQP